jgi:cellulose synthase/poly-beta-1,6-N-acetylglucosamine synthase-like glycosyltransferase
VTGSLADLSFWIAASLLAYSYVAYPAIVLAAAALVGKRRDGPSCNSWPDVAVIIAAHNEEKVIGDRIRNVLEQDYPPERLALIIGSDGSTDSTVEIGRRSSSARCEIRAFDQNRGKASVLNDLIAEAHEPVIICSDANTYFEPDTVTRLAARFVDPAVGAVCGELVLTPPEKARNEDHKYWTIERKLKAAESSIEGLLGANGGVYAFRRALYRPLTPDTICDDFVIVMNVAVTGRSVVYEPRARAYEETPQDMTAEFRRRVRIGVGNYQVLFRHPDFITSANWARRWTYLSHKVLRWLTPHLLLVMLVASGIAMPRQPYAVLFAVQVVAYGTAWLVYATRQTVPWPGLVRLFSLFFVVNLAFGIAFVRFLRGSDSGGWRRTER